MIVSRVIAPTSKLATAKALDPATAASSLGVELALGEVDEDELYAALDWLHERQGAIEATLAKRHLKGGTLVRYDVSSSYVEGRCSRWPSAATTGTARRARPRSSTVSSARPTAAPSRSRCSRAIPATRAPWRIKSAKLKKRFALNHVVLVGDRGMITQARIDADLRPAGLDWITALRAPALQGLVSGGCLQMSLFDERDMAAVTSPDFPASD